MINCRRCGKEIEERYDLMWSYDCHGIPFRLVCFDCAEEIEERGYDGEYYTSADENLDYDY